MNYLSSYELKLFHRNLSVMQIIILTHYYYY